MAGEAGPIALLRRGEVDLATGRGTVAGRDVRLSEMQRLLLGRLAATPGEAVDRAELEQLPGFRPGRKFDPHISLCYGAPPDGHGLDREIEALLDAPVRFGGLAGINASLPVETHDDVASWTVAETYRL